MTFISGSGMMKIVQFGIIVVAGVNLGEWTILFIVLFFVCLFLLFRLIIVLTRSLEAVSQCKFVLWISCKWYVILYFILEGISVGMGINSYFTVLCMYMCVLLVTVKCF